MFSNSTHLEFLQAANAALTLTIVLPTSDLILIPKVENNIGLLKILGALIGDKTATFGFKEPLLDREFVESTKNQFIQPIDERTHLKLL